MKVLIVDNYDSFTYNLYQYVKMAGASVAVKRNDELTLEEINEYDKILLSPGPGLPSETVNMFELLKQYSSKKPILGVCLGMQGIAEFFGAKLLNQKEVRHGVQTIVKPINDSKLYKAIPTEFKAGLYHSWCVDESSLPLALKITGKSIENVVMSIEHISLPIYGVQYHPESIMTECGEEIIKNFVSI